MEILLYIAGGIFALWFLLFLSGIRYIPNNKVGIVEKRWSSKGSLKEQIIALNGEAGFQPDVLRGGICFVPRFIRKVYLVPLVNIPQGELGYVFARDGKPLEGGQTLGRIVPEGRNFQSVRGFLAGGGQKGPQRGMLREGTYAFNLAQFVVFTKSQIHFLPLNLPGERNDFALIAQDLFKRKAYQPVVIDGNTDAIGIVTVHDGPTLATDQIIAPNISTGDPATDHNGFQDPEKFLALGGRRGRQHQVLVEGTYFINGLFATVELHPKTTINVGEAGVVNSFVGPEGKDLSGESYKHGELVEKGHKGVWKETLRPGKYAFNTYAGSVFAVPTTNIILKWIRNQQGAHGFDANLAEVTLITMDAFEPTLPLSVVIHINYTEAPLVIQRFGDIRKLVEQTLDPMVAAYFKNIGQTKTLIQLIQERKEIQEKAAVEMREKFAQYNLNLIEVLIGTPGSSKNDGRIETILGQLQDRQIADEQKTTYERQRQTAVVKQGLVEAQAKSDMQKNLTESAINIELQNNQGMADLRKAEQQANVIQTTARAEAAKTEIAAAAEAKRVRLTSEAEANRVEWLANAEATRIKATGTAEADKIQAIGLAEAQAIRKQVEAYGTTGEYIQLQSVKAFTGALSNYQGDLVPKTQFSVGGGEGKPSNLAEVFMAQLIAMNGGKLPGGQAEYKTTPVEDK